MPPAAWLEDARTQHPISPCHPSVSPCPPHTHTPSHTPHAHTQLVEKLYRAKWTRLDGLGALVLTPTRELAVQIFEELRKVRGEGGRGKRP